MANLVIVQNRQSWRQKYHETVSVKQGALCECTENCKANKKLCSCNTKKHDKPKRSLSLATSTKSGDWASFESDF